MNGTNGAMQVFSGGDFPITSGGFKIIFKNARITADRVIIEPIQPKKPGADK
jgi:acetyl-CoA decarbonylase/synthase complex subunit beta